MSNRPMGSSSSSLYKAGQVNDEEEDLFEDNLQGKFDLKNVVINIVAGLGLLSFISMFCDFILLNYVNERYLVRKYFLIFFSFKNLQVSKLRSLNI